MRFKKGFTLIELLVVVAIIGVLAVIVISSLQSARLRASDASVMASLSSYKNQAELDYPSGNYTGLCASSNYTDIETYVQSQGGNITECDDGTSQYRIIAEFPSSLVQAPSTAYAAAEDGFCVNSFGTSGKVVLSELAVLPSPYCNVGDVSSDSNAQVCKVYTGTYTSQPATNDATGCNFGTYVDIVNIIPGPEWEWACIVDEVWFGCTAERK